MLEPMNGIKIVLPLRETYWYNWDIATAAQECFSNV